MKEERDYIRDITEIRSMMERSSKFLSLSGWAGVMAGMYALTGAWVVWHFFGFNPHQIIASTLPSDGSFSHLTEVVAVAVVVLVLAVGTAIFLSSRKASRNGETVWNATSRRLLANMAVPLVAGGILLLILASKGLAGLLVPIAMIFYGLAIYNGSKFSYHEMKFLGFIQIALGLTGSWFIEYGLLLWTIGFGIVHIIYGIYMHIRYER